MAGCGNCGCNCIIADENGIPFPLGLDRDGNEAIILPSTDQRCGMFEFVHGSTLCAGAVYPMVCMVAGTRITAAVIVLSEIDDAPINIGLRRNGVPIGSMTIPAGVRIQLWNPTAFPITLNQLDQLETSILAAGAQEPVVSIQMTVCVPAS